MPSDELQTTPAPFGMPVKRPVEPILSDGYLCQISARVSCGACCGLYNVADASRSALTALLSQRTKRFAGVPRTVAAILRFKMELQQEEAQSRPLPDFHHCPYLGLVGRHRRTVGCMLHPIEPANGGRDFRSLSYYGGMACHIFFCSATRLLPARHKEIIRAVVNDWYLYGLIITEVKLLKALFSELEDRLGRPLYPKEFIDHPQRRTALYGLLLLRVSWPFRDPARHHLVHYFFNDHRQPRPAIAACGQGHAIQRYHTILEELETEAHTEADLRRAEVYLDDKIRQVLEAF
jgi:hypothetical protein